MKILILGPFTIILKNVKIDGNATIGVEKDGKLKTQHINIDIQFKDMAMDFKNLGFFASVFQSLANSASNVVRKVNLNNVLHFQTQLLFQIFDGIKPMILKDAYIKIREAVDQNLATMIGADTQIPNSISPIDNAIAEARKLVREKG